jgi:hypothetical protein
MLGNSESLVSGSHQRGDESADRSATSFYLSSFCICDFGLASEARSLMYLCIQIGIATYPLFTLWDSAGVGMGIFA